MPGAAAVVLHVCFFISGAAGLVYEVLWAKYLALSVGSTSMAQVIVLATFMGGIALGSQVLGALADRVSQPLKLYVYLEMGIGLYALALFEPILAVGRHLFVALARMGDLGEGGLVLGKIVACVVCILTPTFLMGGTLPALCRHMVRSIEGVGPSVSRLYFVNSLGAVFGCLLAGFYLIQEFGLHFSMIVGAALSICSGVTAFLLTSRGATRPSATGPGGVGEGLPVGRQGGAEGEGATPWAFWVLLGCVGLSGAVSMMYEVAWIRLLTLVLGSSTYSFSLMLAAFILGLSLGGLLLSLRRRPTGYALIFALSEVGVGVSVLVMLPFYARLPWLFNVLASSLSREPATFGFYQLCKFVLCAAVMLSPAILQGVTLPAATKVLAGDARRLGFRVGYVFAVNTLGTLIGSIYAGFSGLPHLGIKGTLELAVGLNCLMGILILATLRPGKARRRGMTAWALAVAATGAWYGLRMGSWDRDVLSVGVYRVRGRIPDYAAFRRDAASRKTLFYRDGVDATVIVQDLPGENPERMLLINGKVDASTVGDLATQKLIGHLPMLCHPNPKKALVVGLGSGCTVGAVLSYDVEKVDVVEISGDVIEASRLFESINGRYWEDPRVVIHHEDAKTFNQVTDEKYDVIISQPTNPWISGVAGVFSREHFEACRERLAPGGLVLQWIQAYETEDRTFYMMLETFTGVFPCYTIWNSRLTDAIIIGSPDPYIPDFSRMEKRLASPSVRKDLEPLGVSSMLTVLGLQMVDRAARPSHIAWGGVVHSDFFPILDYVAPRGFYVGSSSLAARVMDRRQRSPANGRLWISDYLGSRSPTREEFREAYSYAARIPGLAPRLAFAWASQWLACCPDDPEAAAAVASTLGPTHAEAIGLLRSQRLGQGEGARKAIKELCQYLVEDYQSRRNWLRLLGAREVLADLERAAEQLSDAPDADIYQWIAEVQYDMGRYSEAARSVETAIRLTARTPSAEGSTDAGCQGIVRGLLLCEIHLARGDRSAAQAAYENLLQNSDHHLMVRLMRSRIRDERLDTRPGPASIEVP
jgi:predicted membrane-bound spermidine synthase